MISLLLWLRGVNRLEEAWFLGVSQRFLVIRIPAVGPFSDKGWTLSVFVMLVLVGSKAAVEKGLLSEELQLILTSILVASFILFALRRIYWLSDEELREYLKRSGLFRKGR
ncbi:MAG: hypothetical protein WBX25_30680 [Rhodomicrobium sp.]